VESQTIVQGPMASQVAIKMLGTNGGGYTNANAAHPYENPTPLSNFLQIFSIFLIPSGLTYYLGRMVKEPEARLVGVERDGRPVPGGGPPLLGSGEHGKPPTPCAWSESAGGNMEGKEVRFGNLRFRSVRHGHHGRLLRRGERDARFLHAARGSRSADQHAAGRSGLRRRGRGSLWDARLCHPDGLPGGSDVGRTPEYLGKKIESYDVKVSALAVLLLIFDIMVFTAWAVVSKWGLAGLSNAGPHGFSEILYAYSSATANNGSAFAGLTANTWWYNTTLAIAMMIGRFSSSCRPRAGREPGEEEDRPGERRSFPVSGVTFVLLLVGTVLIVGVLSFFPALSVGPIVEHFLMVHSTVVY